MTRTAFMGGVALLGVAVSSASATRAASRSAGLAPILAGKTWLNARASRASLADRVVLVDVFTFECINCTRVTPNLKKLYGEYDREKFEIVAVHTPEVASYQGRTAYLERQIAQAAIPWPVVVDNDYAIWNAYGVSAWPTQLIFDRHGVLRATVIGDSQDGAVSAAVGKALTQAERSEGSVLHGTIS